MVYLLAYQHEFLKIQSDLFDRQVFLFQQILVTYGLNDYQSVVSVAGHCFVILFVSIQLTIETKRERHLLKHFATESTESTEK